MEINQLEKRGFNLSNQVDLDIYQNKTDFGNIVEKVVRSGIEYGIKAIDKTPEMSTLLNHMKGIFKGSEFKKIIGSSIEGSVKEGLEIGKNNIKNLKDMNQFKETSLTGGLNFLLSAGIDIITNKYLAGNILKPHIQKLLKGVKDFLLSNSFVKGIEKGIQKLFSKAKDYKSLCKDWYDSYESFDINSMNEIAQKLERNKTKVGNDAECVTQNNVIQNMTRLINHKKDKLSAIQLQICHEL